MKEQALNDSDAFVILNELDEETRYKYEILRFRQKNGYKATPEEKSFIKSIRLRGRTLWKQRTQAGFQRLFE